MKLKKVLEEKIKKAVLAKISDGGRGNWDIPHTLCAVGWMKRLIAENGGDGRVLLPAIYFHDTCYPPVKAGYSYEKLKEMKIMHAERAAEFSKKTLERIKVFSKDEIREIYRLVKNHDIHNNIEDNNRQLVFEADGLAQLDWEVCPPNFDKKNCLIWMKKYLKVERPLRKWKTKLGRETVQRLMKKAYAYWKDK